MKVFSFRWRKASTAIAVVAVIGGGAWALNLPTASASASSCSYDKTTNVPAGFDGAAGAKKVYTCHLFQDSSVYASTSTSSKVVNKIYAGANWVVCYKNGSANPVTGNGAYKNTYWVLSEGDDNNSFGWVPETVVSEGTNNTPSPGVPACAGTIPPVKTTVKPPVKVTVPPVKTTVKPPVKVTVPPTKNIVPITAPSDTHPRMVAGSTMCGSVGKPYYEENWTNDANRYYAAGQWCMYNPYDKTHVIFSSTGHLDVFSGTHDGQNIWTSPGRDGKYLVFQADGNIVIYDGSAAHGGLGVAVWSSGTSIGEHGKSTLHLYRFGDVKISQGNNLYGSDSYKINLYEERIDGLTSGPKTTVNTFATSGVNPAL